MSWFKENKFVGTLIGVTAVISGGVLFFGITQSGVYDEKLAEYEERQTELMKISKAKPYPDAKNLAIREEGIEKYKATIDEVYQELLKYRPEELKSVSPGEFSDARVAMERKLHAAFAKVGAKVPGSCSFGFEKYAKAQPNADTTSKLYFQLGALDSLLMDLAQSEPATLINIKRDDLPVELGVVSDSEDVYQQMPVELAFTASESSVRSFLKALVNSSEYFYSVNSIRVKNEKQTPPKEQSVDFPVESNESAAGGDADFAGFGQENSEETESAVPVKVMAGEKILSQVAGSELLHVHLSLNILLLNEAAAKGAK